MLKLLWDEKVYMLECRIFILISKILYVEKSSASMLKGSAKEG